MPNMFAKAVYWFLILISIFYILFLLAIYPRFYSIGYYFYSDSIRGSAGRRKGPWNLESNQQRKPEGAAVGLQKCGTRAGRPRNCRLRINDRPEWRVIDPPKTFLKYGIMIGRLFYLKLVDSQSATLLAYPYER